MYRHALAALIILACASRGPVRADDFDYYTNTVLEKVPQAKGVLKVQQLTPELLTEHSGAIKGLSGALVVVKTNEERWSKLVVYAAQQKVATEKSFPNLKAFPILLIERFVTYKDGEERAIQVQGKDVRLFGGFRFNLDIGQVVLPDITADLRFVATDMGNYAVPVGKAELYLVTKPLPEAKPDVSAKVVVGEKFQPQYYSGVYKLYDDGRRSGTLHLTVRDDSVVKGHFFSDKDGAKYDVDGKVGDPHHKIEFKIYYPRTVQQFNGWMFTANGKAFSGWTKLENQETGFYAVRQEAKADGNKKP
jgi:hypothetical protein